MWCFVSRPDSVLLEVELGPKACGQECLDKVCKKLGIVEVDYFGLQYSGGKGTDSRPLWLNTRNRLSRQLDGPPPYRLRFRVKFFVPPHLLLQEATRHMFYLHLKEDLAEGRLTAPTNKAARIAALIAQAETGDYDCNNADLYASCYPAYLPTWSNDILSAIAAEHDKIRGMKRATAEYNMVKECSELEGYGQENYAVKDSSGVNMHIGVGPEGILLMDDDLNTIQSVLFTQVQMATHAGKCFFLTILETTGTNTTLGFKLPNTKMANALYRAVTEKHAFYRCETVRSAVITQFSRDFKGTLVSLFNENTVVGKKYVFDVRRTCREVYEETRRLLYTRGTAVQLPPTEVNSLNNLTEGCRCDDIDCRCGCVEAVELQERICKLEEALLCRVCMDEEISTVFSPCGHVVCCDECAACLEVCPLCRTGVERTQHIFLPAQISRLDIESCTQQGRDSLQCSLVST
ncbi:E3 ubiquitin-protein ligase MYLIP-like [Branchiostoma lanceolatum]|uniref:RING-type E3 ubiquitin transferase n=2 Tax=Branchiostoma lanceolatum TaxID=7740 RepID=A0A8K0A6I8_BRALA|nr:MYLIP [Branchiostoma lanceolatum]